MILVILIPLIYAMVGVTWICMLVTPGDVLGQFPVWFNSKVTSREWVRHVLFFCERCFSGQLALWTYFPVCWYFEIRYDPIHHILIILGSVFCAGFIGKLYNRI